MHNQFGNSGKKSKEFDRRDSFENDLLRKYIGGPQYSNLPFLGVCYGMQMLAAAEDIPLVVDIHAQLGLENRMEKTDQVNLNSSSVLRKFTDAATFPGPENHHQAVDLEYLKDHATDYPTVKVTGTSNNGKIPEVLELTNRPAVGIQFHAESSADVAAQSPFAWFLDSACTRKMNPKTTAPQNVSPANSTVPTAR